MYIEVKVTPDAKKETFTEISPKSFQISVKEKAVRNMANTRVRELFSEHFGVPLGSVRIVSGHRSTKKIISVGS